MAKKVMIVLGIFHLLGFIQSCCHEEIECYWKDCRIENIDNSDVTPVISYQLRIPKKAYGIRVSMIDSLIFNDYASLNIIENAKATSCGEEYIVSKKVDKIKILLFMKSLSICEEQDYTSHFKARKTTETNGRYQSIKEIISYLNSSETFMDANRSSYGPAAFDLYLIDNADIQDTCFFRINLQFNDSTILSHETPPVLLY